jgi:hypothetical protein
MRSGLSLEGFANEDGGNEDGGNEDFGNAESRVERGCATCESLLRD